MRRRAATAIVTDHAVLRYLERQCGVDVEGIRRHIAELCRQGVELSGDGVVAEGAHFVLRDRAVITVLDRRWLIQKHRQEERDA